MNKFTHPESTFEVKLYSTVDYMDQFCEMMDSRMSITITISPDKPLSMLGIEEALEVLYKDFTREISFELADLHYSNLAEHASLIIHSGDAHEEGVSYPAYSSSFETRPRHQVLSEQFERNENTVLLEILQRHPILGSDGTVLLTDLPKILIEHHWALMFKAEDRFADAKLNPEDYKTVALLDGVFTDTYRVPLHFMVEDSTYVQSISENDFRNFVYIFNKLSTAKK